MKKTIIGVVALAAIVLGGAGCFDQNSQQTPPPPVTQPAPAPTPTPTPTPAPSPTVSLDENSDGKTIQVMPGSTIDLVLHSTYWQIQPTKSPVLKPLMDEPLVTGQLSNPPGMGKGTVEMKYQVVAAGTAVITASRTTCGEAMKCVGKDGAFKVTIAAGPTASAPTTVLVSEAKTTDYCDGAKMDSDGYRKTLIKEQPFTPAPDSASEADRLRAVLAAATTGMCKTVMTQLDVSVKDGVATIPPIDGWAGVSITMCSCKPQVEVNLLRQPGITSVQWQ